MVNLDCGYTSSSTQDNALALAESCAAKSRMVLQQYAEVQSKYTIMTVQWILQLFEKQVTVQHISVSARQGS